MENHVIFQGYVDTLDYHQTNCVLRLRHEVSKDGQVVSRDGVIVEVRGDTLPACLPGRIHENDHLLIEGELYTYAGTRILII